MVEKTQNSSVMQIASQASRRRGGRLRQRAPVVREEYQGYRYRLTDEYSLFYLSGSKEVGPLHRGSFSA